MLSSTEHTAATLEYLWTELEGHQLREIASLKERVRLRLLLSPRRTYTGSM
jgi:hypothetical protein